MDASIKKHETPRRINTVFTAKLQKSAQKGGWSYVILGGRFKTGQ
jgi:hypothetical protein